MSTPILELSKEADLSMAEEWFEMVDEDHIWFRWRLRETLKAFKEYGIDTSKKLHLLEVGTGGSHLRKQLEDATGWTIDGCDLNRTALEQGKSCRGQALLYNILDEHPDYMNRYDGVVMFDVIEHIKDYDSFISASLKHVKPGGLVLVNVPALQICYSKYDEAIGHYRRYNSKSLSQVFTKQKIVDPMTYYWGLTLVPVLFVRKWMMMFINNDIKTVVSKGMQPQSALSEGILRLLMYVDGFFNRRFLGSSVLLVAKKGTS
jgi:SAM-dependent methyltransferase